MLLSGIIRAKRYMYSRYFGDFKAKYTLTSFLVCWLVFINIWIFKYQDSHSLKTIKDSIYLGHISEQATGNPEAVNFMDNHSLQLLRKEFGIQEPKPFDAHAKNYDSLFEHHNFNGVLSQLSFSERCDLYFSNLYANDINWYMDPDVDLPLENRHQYNYEDFKNMKFESVKEGLAKDADTEKDKVSDEKVEERIKEDYTNFWNKMIETEQKMTDYISHLRIFNKCYVTGDNKKQIDKSQQFVKLQSKFIKSLSKSGNGKFDTSFKMSSILSTLNTDSFETCSDLETRLYPWLSMSYPVYERWTGDKYISPPDMKNYIRHSEPFKMTKTKMSVRGNNDATGRIDSKLTNGQSCFLNRFKNKVNGKGIVLSIGESHVEDTLRLIHLLRALNNKYPIQIVYNDALSSEAKQKIVDAAQEQLASLPSSFGAVSHKFPDDYLDPVDNGLVKQEVWFVNVHHVINDKYKGKFKMFANKFLATAFNSFEEFILLDADTVLMQNPEYFFNLKGYKEKGAFFYRDRTSAEFRPASDAFLFKKITPSVVDKVIFDIPLISDKILKFDFYAGLGQWMESGLVVINRKLHFSSILMMIQLNFFNPVTTRVYGDKEIMWLAFTANGDNDFQFNKLTAAAIGEETPTTERLTEKGKPRPSKELCSAHPGHIDGDDGKTLVWFNSGFKFCGQGDKVNYQEEFKQSRRFKHIKTINDMRIFFENPMKIRHAVIPPFKNKLETLCDNSEGEPNQGWRMDSGYCNSYLWCAYSQIGGMTQDGNSNVQRGKFIEFDQDSIDLFTYLGDVWNFKE